MQGAGDLRGRKKSLFFHLSVMLALSNWVDGSAPSWNGEDCKRSTLGGMQGCTKVPDPLDSLPMITASLACASLYLQHLGTEVPQVSWNVRLWCWVRNQNLSCVAGGCHTPLSISKHLSHWPVRVVGGMASAMSLSTEGLIITDIDVSYSEIAS